MDHDLYKPLFNIRLEDLDPARHHLLLDCACGHTEDADIRAWLAKEKPNYPIAWIGKWAPCPECGRQDRFYRVTMREGVRKRTLKEVDPNR
ncbi:hypothetical protein [Taklimakanibacter deserti]|uniref:hypothetical protein n=1 Tax=Taklimakanibacter deserti TaxID=2267839 RepID=UPI0013C43D62